jgi:hypothetical protein
MIPVGLEGTYGRRGYSKIRGSNEDYLKYWNCKQTIA